MAIVQTQYGPITLDLTAETYGHAHAKSLTVSGVEYTLSMSFVLITVERTYRNVGEVWYARGTEGYGLTRKDDSFKRATDKAKDTIASLVFAEAQKLFQGPKPNGCGTYQELAREARACEV